MSNFLKKRRLKVTIFWLFLFLLSFGITEFISNIIYYVIKGELFPFSNYESERIVISQPANFKVNKQGGGIHWDERSEVLHPYLGYVADPQKKPGFSEFGFPGKLIPIGKKNEQILTVAIMGGSFAENFEKFGNKALTSKLKEFPEFNKKIVIYSLALGGYKQPQQLMTLSYMLSLGVQFDIIINIDGFNEITLPITDNIPTKVYPFYPRSWYFRVYNFNDPQFVLLLGEISLLNKKRKKWANFFSTKLLDNSIVSNIIWKYFDSSMASQKQKDNNSLLQYEVKRKKLTRYISTGPPFHFESEAELYEALVQIWKESSIQMHKLSLSNDILYFHFLQPNQYVKGSKIMNKEELRVAYSKDQIYKKHVENGYPVLRRVGSNLIKSGVNYHDLTMVFEHYDEPLYMDDCCHVVKRGYELIGTAIGEYIGNAYRGERNQR